MINNNFFIKNHTLLFFSWWNTYVSLIYSWVREKRECDFPIVPGIENIRIMGPFLNKCYDIMAINSVYLVRVMD